MKNTIKKMLLVTLLVLTAFSVFAFTQGDNITASAAGVTVAAPKGVKVNWMDADSITIEWKLVNNADCYELYMYDSGLKKWKKISTTELDFSCAEDLKPATVYKFRVKACIKEKGKIIRSKASATLTATTRPEQVLNLGYGKIKSDSFKLSWDKVKGASGYRIYVYNKTVRKWEKLTDVKSTSYTVKKLSSATQYNYRVKAYLKFNGKTVWGIGASETLRATTRPEAVKNIRATKVGTHALTLKWDKVKRADGYEIYKYDDFQKKWELADRLYGKNSCTVDWLEPVRTYKFRVKAFKESANYTLSSGETQTYKCTTIPVATVKIACTTSAEFAILRWKKVDKATSYRVYQKTANGWTPLGYTDKQTFTVNKLKKDTAYTFAVKSYAKVGSQLLEGEFRTINIRTDKIPYAAITDGGIKLYPVTSETAKKIADNWISCYLYDYYEGKSADGKTVVVYISAGGEWYGRDIEGTQYDSDGNISICEYCGRQLGEKPGMCDGGCAIVFH